jgi:hypothetical protein
VSFKGREGRIVGLQINEVDNGFIVNAGCKTLVFPNSSQQDLDHFLALLTTYVANPESFLESISELLGLALPPGPTTDPTPPPRPGAYMGGAAKSLR